MIARVLFVSTVALALLLLAAVALSPVADSSQIGSDGWGRLIALFAQDRTVRRTTVAGAAGMLATAFVFFRVRKAKETP